MINAQQIEIRGLVQGVGFRPFVYREAQRLEIQGYIANTGYGVIIHAQGERLEEFIDTLRKHPPKRARIDSFDCHPASVEEYNSFEIRLSIEGEGNIVIPADIALCSTCEQEMRDPNNRRYNHPFITCTECGPRYTIMQIPPYDRVRTSMKHFTMCDQCASEYIDPTSRRYHAQPISCHQCGPILSLYDISGNTIDGDPIKKAAAMIGAGKIIAVKGIGGFHLVCNAADNDCVDELRRRKNRPSKPFAVMFSSAEHATFYSNIKKYENALLTGAFKPIVIVEAKASSGLSPSVAPGIQRLGVLLPYTPLHRLLFDHLDVPLIMTSANRSGEPILTRKEDIFHHLSNIADAVLDHDRIIVNPIDDTVVQAADGRMIMLRMGRGFTPFTKPLETTAETTVLALGAHQKNAISIVKEKQIVLSGHIGDLENIENQEFYERTIHTYKRFYGLQPNHLIHDLHPHYFSTKHARSQQIQHHSIQHHYAHILSCMAEYGLTDRVLGFAFDGTGYGDDATLWGGEVILADCHTYERISHLKPFPLLGAEKAIREPRRVALALLFEHYSLDDILALSSPVTDSFLDHEIRQLHYLWSKQLNSPLTSSVGRLFDAVASLGGFIQTLDYEGQAGLLIESYVDDTINEPFAFDIEENRFNMTPMIVQIVQIQLSALDINEKKRLIASRFVATIIALIRHYADSHPDFPIIVAGGVFQNRVIMERLYQSLSSRQFYAQQVTPMNDGSIALGQAWWGLHNL